MKLPVMTARVIVLAFVLLTGLTAAETAVDFEYGRRPARSVFDPNNILDPGAMIEISEPLVKIRDAEGIDIVVVILDVLDGAQPELVAKNFAAAWCDPRLNSVVLHVPGHADSPWIVPAGKLVESIKPEILAQTVADARRRASREAKESAKVRAAATEAADMLRYWMGTAVNRNEFLETERIKIQVELETQARQWRIASLTGMASIVPIVLGVSILFFSMREPGPRMFPNVKSPRRLGAPHAGGNHAVTDLGPPLP